MTPFSSLQACRLRALVWHFWCQVSVRFRSHRAAMLKPISLVSLIHLIVCGGIVDTCGPLPPHMAFQLGTHQTVVLQ